MIEPNVPYLVEGRDSDIGEVRKTWNPNTKIKEICTTNKNYAERMKEDMNQNPKKFIYSGIEKDCMGTEVWCFKMLSPRGFAKRIRKLTWPTLKNTNVLEVQIGDTFLNYKDFCERLCIPYIVNKKNKDKELEWLYENVFSWENKGRAFVVTKIHKENIAEHLANVEKMNSLPKNPGQIIGREYIVYD